MKSRDSLKDAKLKQKLFFDVAKEFCARTSKTFNYAKVISLIRQWKIMCKNYNICLQRGTVLGFDYLSHCSFLTEPSKLPDCAKKKDPHVFRRETRRCCACGSPNQRFLMLLLCNPLKKRMAWLGALGLPQEKIDSINARHTVTNPLYLCMAHFPAGAFVYGDCKKRILDNVLPLKLEDTRSNEEVLSSIKDSERTVSLGKGQLNSNRSVPIGNDEQIEEVRRGNQFKLRLEKDQSNLSMNITERQKRALEEEFVDDDLEPLKRPHRSCSPVKEDSQLSLLLGSRSWLDLVNVLHPSTDNMNADELNEHQTMLSILRSNNIEPEDDNSSGNETTLCISSLDLLHEGTELKDLFHCNAHSNNSSYAHCSINDIGPIRGDLQAETLKKVGPNISRTSDGQYSKTRKKFLHEKETSLTLKNKSKTSVSANDASKQKKETNMKKQKIRGAFFNLPAHNQTEEFIRMKKAQGSMSWFHSAPSDDGLICQSFLPPPGAPFRLLGGDREIMNKKNAVPKLRQSNRKSNILEAKMEDSDTAPSRAERKSGTELKLRKSRMKKNLSLKLQAQYSLPYFDRPLNLYALTQAELSDPTQESDMFHSEDRLDWTTFEPEIAMQESVVPYSPPALITAYYSQQEIATDPCNNSEEAVVSKTHLTALMNELPNQSDGPPQPTPEPHQLQDSFTRYCQSSCSLPNIMSATDLSHLQATVPNHWGDSMNLETLMESMEPSDLQFTMTDFLGYHLESAMTEIPTYPSLTVTQNTPCQSTAPIHPSPVTLLNLDTQKVVPSRLSLRQEEVRAKLSAPEKATLSSLSHAPQPPGIRRQYITDTCSVSAYTGTPSHNRPAAPCSNMIDELEMSPWRHLQRKVASAARETTLPPQIPSNSHIISTPVPRPMSPASEEELLRCLEEADRSESTLSDIQTAEPPTTSHVLSENLPNLFRIDQLNSDSATNGTQQESLPSTLTLPPMTCSLRNNLAAPASRGLSSIGNRLQNRDQMMISPLLLRQKAAKAMLSTKAPPPHVVTINSDSELLIVDEPETAYFSSSPHFAAIQPNAIILTEKWVYKGDRSSGGPTSTNYPPKDGSALPSGRTLQKTIPSIQTQPMTHSLRNNTEEIPTLVTSGLGNQLQKSDQVLRSTLLLRQSAAKELMANTKKTETSPTDPTARPTISLQNRALLQSKDRTENQSVAPRLLFSLDSAEQKKRYLGAKQICCVCGKSRVMKDLRELPQDCLERREWLLALGLSESHRHKIEKRVADYKEPLRLCVNHFATPEIAGMPSAVPLKMDRNKILPDWEVALFIPKGQETIQQAFDPWLAPTSSQITFSDSEIVIIEESEYGSSSTPYQAPAPATAQTLTESWVYEVEVPADNPASINCMGNFHQELEKDSLPPRYCLLTTPSPAIHDSTQWTQNQHISDPAEIVMSTQTETPHTPACQPYSTLEYGAPQPQQLTDQEENQLLFNHENVAQPEPPINIGAFCCACGMSRRLKDLNELAKDPRKRIYWLMTLDVPEYQRLRIEKSICKNKKIPRLCRDHFSPHSFRKNGRFNKHAVPMKIDRHQILPYWVNALEETAAGGVQQYSAATLSTTSSSSSIDLEPPSPTSSRKSTPTEISIGNRQVLPDWVHAVYTPNETDGQTQQSQPVSSAPPPTSSARSSANKSSRVFKRSCCACGSSNYNSMMVNLSTVEKTRIACLRALGLHERAIDYINGQYQRGAKQTFLCRAHYPAEAFLHGRLLHQKLPMKLEYTRTNEEVLAEMQKWKTPIASLDLQREEANKKSTVTRSRPSSEGPSVARTDGACL